MLMHRLRGNRDDLTALHWSNLLVVEQGFSSAPPIHKIKTPRWGVFILWRCGKILRQTPYNKIQGLTRIFEISAPRFSPTAPDFRDFYKNTHKNNRELKFIEQGFHPPISGTNPAPPPPKYMSPFIANSNP